MGLSFTGDGKYVGWSNLFNFSSIKTLEASEFLPKPRGRRYAYNKNAKLDITEDLKLIQSLEQKLEENKDSEELIIQRINAYSALIRKLNKVEDTHEIIKNEKPITCYSVSWNLKGGRDILNTVERHEITRVPVTLQEASDKNFISSHIQYTVQNLRNMIGAYSPIQMEALRSASLKSPKGEQASKLTLMNPATKWIMQRQNIVGKDVIGIAANGEKTSFMWHYWINNVLSKAKTDEDVKYIKFDFTSKRVAGRSSGNPSEIKINTLPQVNSENISSSLSPAARNIFMNNKLTGNITVDLMISQVLSAATDNAKELILDKINCDSNFANMYLFLITLGFNITDIVSFMTSPVVNFVANMVSSNIFSDNVDVTIDMALGLAQNSFDDKFFETYLGNNWANQIIYKINKAIKDNTNPFKSGSQLYYMAEDKIKGKIDDTAFEDAIIENLKNGNVEDFELNFRDKEGKIINNEIPLYKKFVFYKKKISQIKALRNFDPESQDVLDDINEFKKIRKGAQEFTNAASFLGINQGIKTSKADLNTFLGKMANAYKSNVSKLEGYKNLAEEYKNLNVQRFLTDEEYKNNIIEIYDSAKSCLNVFALIDQIPQYKSLYKLLDVVVQADENISMKSRIYNDAYNKIKKLGGWQISEKYQKGLLRGIDNVLIKTFFEKNLIKPIPYGKGTSVLNKFQMKTKAVHDGVINFSEITDVAKFKDYFENVIIPGLQRGVKYDYNSDKVVTEIPVAGLKENKFIQALIRGRDGNLPYYKCKFDLLLAKNNITTKKQLATIVKGLRELKDIKINGTSLSDLFMMYNLIVHKNYYGSERMTTLFESFLENSFNKNNFIYKYLNWLGKLDFKGEMLNYNLNDLMLEASSISQYTSGQTDPSYIYQDPNTNELTFKVKSFKNYVSQDYNMIISLPQDADVAKRLERIQNYFANWTLGGAYESYIKQTIDDIQTINSNILGTLSDLVQKGLLTIQKICK